MTQEEILEFNKKCAEFLGFKYRNHAKFWGIYPLDNNSYLRQLGYVRMDNLKFHSDWNWIHSVVEAIEKLKYLVVIQSNFCQIQEIGERENNFKPYIISSFYGNSKKEAITKSIGKFLIWYNERNISNI